jgi:lipopolysaccharide export system protein LptC
MNRLTTASINPQTTRSYWSMGRGNAARAFRAARKHSRLVRILRVVVPLAVLLGVTAITLITYFNPLRMLTSLPIDIGSVVVSGTKITMEAPRLSGFTRDARAYELNADSAAQDLTRPDVVELHHVRAAVQMQDKSTAKLTADSGLYNSKKETLRLNKNIILNSTAGYQGRLSEAQIDIRKGHVVSEQPVEVTMLQGVLNANRMEITDSGDLMRFDGGVTMTLTLNKGDAPKEKAATQ